MRRIIATAILLAACVPGFAGEAEVKAAQTVIDGQIKAFLADAGVPVREGPLQLPRP